jgi:hypothetical protein
MSAIFLVLRPADFTGGNGGNGGIESACAGGVNRTGKINSCALLKVSLPFPPFYWSQYLSLFLSIL